MQDERNNGIKVKIFLAIFMTLICVIFIVYAYNFININKKYINEESKLSNDCLNINFDVINTKYSGNNLLIVVQNKLSSYSAITTINVILSNETKSKEVKINPSNQEEILFENLVIAQENILVYPNNCEIYAKTTFIKKS